MTCFVRFWPAWASKLQGQRPCSQGPAEARALADRQKIVFILLCLDLSLV